MSVTWTVSHPARLIVAVGKDEVTSTDILYCADEFAKNGINAYRKLFDLTRIARTMPQADMQLVGKRMGARASGQAFGPIAIVVSSSVIAGSAKIFQATATEPEAAKRPVQIFRDLYAARAWLDEIAPPDGIAPPDQVLPAIDP
jgi:hypothetical protein